jgi:hypothetical protein
LENGNAEVSNKGFTGSADYNQVVLKKAAFFITAISTEFEAKLTRYETAQVYGAVKANFISVVTMCWYNILCLCKFNDNLNYGILTRK